MFKTTTSSLIHQAELLEPRSIKISTLKGSRLALANQPTGPTVIGPQLIYTIIQSTLEKRVWHAFGTFFSIRDVQQKPVTPRSSRRS